MSAPIELRHDPQVSERLTRLWETPSTLLGWIATVDHKTLGIRYIVTASVFLFLGGVEAILLRLQLIRPENHLLSPAAFNQLFTMHGTTMMFLFVQPVLSGFSFYLTPLLIGARELAFPRLNTFSYYGFLLAGLFLYASFLIGQAPNGGWFNYTPLTSLYTPGYNIDFYALGLLLLGVSTTAGAINLIVTIFKLRAPGMSLDKIPLMLWSSLTTSFAVVFSIPALTVALVFLELARRWHFGFFDPALGGSPLLWQHLFWVFGHPWVYIVFLPATGMLSMIIPAMSRRPMVGHNLIVGATIATGLAGFGVWAHHMFVTGLPQISVGFFSAGSMVVSIPSAVQVFAWIATMWHGKVVLKTPMLFTLGFIVQFVLGGISGVMTAVVPFDWQAHDTYFVVAHLHYVLAGGSLFALFAALYYWFPKMRGRLLDERLGKASFWVMLVGFNLAFFPMHIAGLLGMVRRIYTYAPNPGVAAMNLASTIGALVFATGTLLTLWNLLRSYRGGRPAGPDPWGAHSLEWATSSPPPDYNFARIPVVSSQTPLWDGGLAPGPAFDEKRLTPRTSALDGELEAAEELPEGNLWTVVIAVTLLLASIGLLLGWTWVTIASALASLFAIGRWMWPRLARVDRTEV